MTEKLKILIDMDGTIADWGKEYDRMLGTYYSDAANIPRTIDQQAFNLMAGRTLVEQGIISEIMDLPGFYARLLPIEGAIDALKEMLALGHDVRIVTSPWLTNPTCINDKFAWIEKYLGKDWMDRVIVTKDKTHISGDILIDDKPEITGSCAPTWTHILFDQPYNQHIKDKDVLSDWRYWEDTVNEYIQPNPYLVNAAKALAENEKAVTDKWVPGTEVRSVSATGGEKGVKDQRFDLIPVGALTKLAEHFGVGARKYADNQWRKGYEWSKSYAALQRHATQFWNGEDFDEETGSNHMAAVAWHAFAMLTFYDEFPEFDDRFKK